MAELQTEGVAGVPARADLDRGWHWVWAGWKQVRSDPPLWLGMSAIYLLLATLLGHIPFAGFLLLVMISPMLLAGALLALHEGRGGADAGGPLSEWVRRPAKQLLRAADESHAFAIVLLCIVTLGLVVTLRITEYFLGVSSVHSVIGAFTHRAGPPVWLLTALLVAAALNIGLLMGLFYAAHRTVLAAREPMLAVHDSFMACAGHAVSLTVLIGVFVGLGVCILGAFYASALFGYLLLYSLGLIALPVLVCASYHSYRAVFASPVPTPPTSP
jgi:hypothetical protein